MPGESKQPEELAKQQRIVSIMKQIRLEAGLSVDELAARLGVAHAWVMDCECGRSPLPLEDMLRWCQHCQANVEHVFGQMVDELDSPDGQTEDAVVNRKLRRPRQPVHG